jgi:non-ribosomal peptide synthetase component F
MQAGLFDDDIRYWRDHLNAAVTEFEVPGDRPRLLTSQPIPGYIPFRLEEDTAKAARAFARRAGATLFMVMLAGYKCLLQRWTGQIDISVGCPVAGRTRRELEPLIGLFLNEMVLTTNLAGNPSFADVVARVRETTLAAYSHQNVPFDELVRICRPARSLESGAVYRVGFNLNSTPPQELSFPGIYQVRTLDTGQRTSKFDLSAELSDDGKTIGGLIDYNQALYDTSTIQRFASQYHTLLAEATAQPERQLSDFLDVNVSAPTLLAAEFNVTFAYE